MERHARPLLAIFRHYQWYYLLLGFVIMGPLLMPGYILALDMIFTPKLPLPSTLSSSYVFHALLHYLNNFLPSPLIQKALLLGIFVIAGMSMHQLIRHYSRKDSKAERLGAYFAGTFYILNPFVYERFMTGQYSVLFGYALMPLFVRYLLQFLAQPAPKTVLRLSLVSLALSIVSIHAIFPAFLIALGAVGRTYWRQRHNGTQLKQLTLYLGVWAGGLLILSSYWLMPLILGHGHTANLINSFSAGDQQAFATIPGQLGLFGNVLSLQGFWAEAQNLFLLPSDRFGWWLWPIIGLWTLIICGSIISWRRSQARTLSYATLTLLGTLLAIGTAGTIAAQLNSFLIRVLPFFSGYREPQKFVMLLALSFAYFGAQGVEFIAEKLRDNIRLLTLGVAFLLPLLLTPFLPLGAAGQLHTSDYPHDWYVIRDTLATKERPKTVFLPWHLYMSFSFANRVIANPAPQFFPGTVYVTNNLEFGDATNGTPSTTVSALNNILATAPSRHDLAANLRARGVQYVILDKDFDYSNYAYVANEPGLRSITTTPSMTLYEVER